MNDKLKYWLKSCYDDCHAHTNYESSMFCAILNIIENPENYRPYLIYRYKVLREFLSKLYLNNRNKVLNDLFYYDAVVGKLDDYYNYYNTHEIEAIDKRKDKNMGKDNILVNCWYRLWNKVDSDDSFMHPDVSKKFSFITDIINGDKVDTSEYTHLELIEFIDNITRSVDIAKCDWPLVTRIVNCVNACYQDVDAIEDRPNTPKEAQKELLKVLRSIWRMSDFIKEDIFGTSKYCDILQLDPDEIITKYNNYIKSKDYKIADEICLINNPDIRAWITKIESYDFDCLLDNGSVRCFPKTDVKKTGRHNVSLGAALQDNMEGCIIMEKDKNLWRA